MIEFGGLVFPEWVVYLGGVVAVIWIATLAYMAVGSVIYRLGFGPDLPGWTAWDCTNCDRRHRDFINQQSYCPECGEMNWGEAERLGWLLTKTH